MSGISIRIDPFYIGFPPSQPLREDSSSEDSSSEEIGVKCDPTQWAKMPIPHCDYRREIFINQPNSTPRLVAKIESSLKREEKLEVVLPHAEEISYKICKMFHWNTIPKTKVVHQYSISNENQTKKLQKYAKLMKGFNSELYPRTVTFQAFVEGKIFPEFKESYGSNLPSFQKAFLLNMVLGKFDAKHLNTILNHQTYELFEIDNEYIGKTCYESKGTLNNYTQLKKEEIPPEILDNVLSISLTELTKIRDKYKVRDENLIAYWNKEPHPEPNDCGDFERNFCWQTIMENFIFLKMGIHALRESRTPVTIENLEIKTFEFYNEPRKRYFTPTEMNAILSNCKQKKYLPIIEALIKEGLIEKEEGFSEVYYNAIIYLDNFRTVLFNKYPEITEM
jgi:hypothetical protein